MKMKYHAMLFAAAFLFIAADKNQFDQVVDFSINLEKLQTQITDNPKYNNSKLLVLDGTIAALNFVNEEEDSFSVQFELLNGQWKSLSEVESYICSVECSGKNFYSFFISEEEESDSILTANSQLIVVGRLLRIEKNAEGKPIAVIQAVYLRKI